MRWIITGRGTFGSPGLPSRNEPAAPRGYVGTTVALFALACSACGPSPEDAAITIKSHLEALAPQGLQQDRWADVRVEVLALEPGSEGRYEATFQAFNPTFVHGAADTMRGPTYTIELSRGDAGFTVERYGEELSRAVAVMVAADRKTRYAPLLEQFTELMDSARAALSDWARPLKAQLGAQEDSADLARVIADAEAGIPAAALSAGISARGWDQRPDVEWGVAGPDPEGRGVVLWLSPAAEPEVACARLIGEQPPAAFSWLDGQFPTCRGRGGRYVDRYPPEDVLEEIAAAGRILRPAAPPSGQPSPEAP